MEDIYSQDNGQQEDHEISIYDSTSSAEKTEAGDSQEPTHSFTYSPSDKKLCFIGNDMDHIPAEMIYEFGLKTLVLDISFNAFSDLRDLQQFPYLEELICDNNLISEDTHFPKLEHLKLFSCNKNNVQNIHIFIDKLKVLFPNLTYLSLLGNIACPNQLVDPSKDEYDYSRYRKYVLYRMKNLKFLDCYEVTSVERELLAKEELFFEVVTLKESDTNKNLSSSPESNSGYTPLSNKSAEIENVVPHGSFGHSKYIYHGKQSEGNRFIRNDDL